MRSAHPVAGDGDGSLVTLDQAADDVEQCRLAATGRPDHGQELTRLDAERDMIDRSERALGGLEALDDIVDDENPVARRCADGSNLAHQLPRSGFCAAIAAATPGE